MKSLLLTSFTVLLFVMIYVTKQPAYATVGGPVFVENIAYSAASNSIYYQEENYTARDCANPLLWQINLTTSSATPVMTCQETYDKYFAGGDTGEEWKASQIKYDAYMSNFYRNLAVLPRISFDLNKISINVTATSEHFDGDMKFWTNFRATVSQDGTEISTIEFRGCSSSQPHLFQGYRIPNSDTLILTISGTGNCLEGGYLNETVYIINGVKRYSDFELDLKELLASERNTLVYASTTSPAVATTSSLLLASDNSGSTPPSPSPLFTILLTVIFTLSGIILGFVLGTHTNKPTKPASEVPSDNL